MSEPRVPKQVKMEFHYDTSGAIVITCNQKCGYRNTMFSHEVYPTDSVYLMRFTIDQLYHALQHMQVHIKSGIAEGKVNAEQGTDISTDV